MPKTNEAPLHTWLVTPMEPATQSTIDRVRRALDVAHVAVMPDVADDPQRVARHGPGGQGASSCPSDDSIGVDDVD
jgi:hypothetical protein